MSFISELFQVFLLELTIFIFAINNSGNNSDNSMCQIQSSYSLTSSRFHLVVDIEVIADMID